MARYGPLTLDSTTVALGLAQIRVGASAANITRPNPVLASTDSIGALASTKFSGETEYFHLESGFPMLEDAVFPLREKASLECAFKEITPANIAMTRGLDPASYSASHAGSIALGSIATPEVIRMEAVYTYPDQTNALNIIFPVAQCTSPVEIDFAEEEPAAVPMVFESKRADGDASGGHSTWDDMPLGQIIWSSSDTTWTTTTTTSSTTSSTTSTAA